MAEILWGLDNFLKKRVEIKSGVLERWVRRVKNANMLYKKTARQYGNSASK